jgi:hypothetical protein
MLLTLRYLLLLISFPTPAATAVAATALHSVLPFEKTPAIGFNSSTMIVLSFQLRQLMSFQKDYPDLELGRAPGSCTGT